MGEKSGINVEAMQKKTRESLKIRILITKTEKEKKIWDERNGNIRRKKRTEKRA